MKIFDPYDKNVYMTCERFKEILQDAYSTGYHSEDRYDETFEYFFEHLELKPNELKTYNDQYGI